MDLSVILGAVNVAGSVGASLKSATDAGVAIRSLLNQEKVSPELQLQIQNMHIALLEAYGQQAELQAMLTTVHADCKVVADFERETADWQKVELHEGNYAWTVVGTADTLSRSEYFCTTCFEGKQISTLQKEGRVLNCPRCGAKIETEPRPVAAVYGGFARRGSID